MKVDQAIAIYVAYKQSLGMRFATEARTLKSFSKSVGAVDVDRIGLQQVRDFLDGNGPMTRFWHRTADDALRCSRAGGTYCSEGPEHHADPRGQESQSAQHSALSTLPDYVLYFANSRTFPGDTQGQSRHSLCPFEQRQGWGNGASRTSGITRPHRRPCSEDLRYLTRCQRSGCGEPAARGQLIHSQRREWSDHLNDLWHPEDYVWRSNVL
jgi:hypothetical protein